MGLIESATAADASGWREETEFPTFIMGLDLGQAADYTAICILEHRRIFTHHFSGQRKQTGETFDVRHMQRLPLGMPYPAQVAEVVRIASRSPIAGLEVMVDRTGVGRAVGDIFAGSPLKTTAVTITAGDTQNWVNGGWNVSKGILVSTLDARLNTGELRFAKSLVEAGVLAEELKDFQRKVSSAGRYSYDARVGKHDDLVLAVAIALWGCTGRPVMPAPQFGSY